MSSNGLTIDDPALATPSPKRKRDDIPTSKPQHSPVQPGQLNTSIVPIPSSVVVDEGDTGSPRTKVMNQFKGLKLDPAIAVPKFDLGGGLGVDDAMEEDQIDNSSIKRVRIFGTGDSEIPETPDQSAHLPVRNASIATTTNGLPLSGEVDPKVFTGFAARSSASKLVRAYPSINRLMDSKSRARKRYSSPPPSVSNDRDVEPPYLALDRAALTWHDDEITGHDPSDPEDDGEGINGIGFKPTPAIAYARAESRRKQLAEYRSRESKDARAKRNERRRGSFGHAAREEAARRVRFLEAEANSAVSASRI